MKLIFSKNEEENVAIQIVKGTSTIDFTYVDMVKELLNDNTIEDPDFNDDIISDEEQERIKSMLNKISEAISNNKEGSDDVNEDSGDL